MEGIEHEYTKQIVCPWCGYELEDCWEWGDSGDEETCSDCGKVFSYERNMTVDYCTTRKQCEEGKCEYIIDTESAHGGEPYIYDDRNWTIYKCKHCHDRNIKTGPIAADGKPYTIKATG